MNNFLLGIKLFNEADFFSAHDAFEDEWRSCNDDDKLFFQGLTQVAVGSFHFASGNYKGSLSQFQKGISKLKKYPSFYKNIDLGLLIGKVSQINENMEVNFNNLDKLKGIEIPTINTVETN